MRTAMEGAALAQSPRPRRTPEPADAAVTEALPDVAITFITIGAIVVGAFVVTRLVRRALDRVVARHVPDSVTRAVGEQRTRTLAAVAKAAVSAVVWTVAVLLVLSEAGINIGPLVAAAGIGGVALGFGAQHLVRDIIAGFFILFEDQFHVGDVVQIVEVTGVVEKITLRTTVLRDLSGHVHTVPNGEIRVTTNLTKDFSRYLVDLPVPYEEDVDRVVAVVQEVAETMRREPAFAGVILGPLTVLGVDDYAASQVTVKVYLETLPGKQWDVGREFRRRVKRAYDENGISIPFPHREVILRQAADGTPAAGSGDAGRPGAEDA